MTDIISPIVPIGSYIPPYMPLSNITPFTYRDGLTYLEVLECLRTYVNTTLVDFVNTNFGILGDDFSSEVNTLIEAVNTQLDNQTATVNTAIANLTTYVDSSAADDKTYVDTQIATMQTIVNQAVTDVENSAITLQDVVLNGIIQDTSSQSRAELDTIYADKATQTTVESGYLTQTNLDERYDKRNELVINIKDYGAVGDGITNDRVAIQSAITAMQTAGIKTLLVPDGEYIVDLSPGLDYMLQLIPNMVIRGVSRNGSIIKVSDTAGDYRAIFAGIVTNTDLSNLIIENITIDNNNTGNPASSTTPMFAGYPRYTLYAPVADNVIIRNTTIKDVDSVNTLSISGKNTKIYDNLFTNIGTSIAVHDHSTIYISGNTISIKDNTFQGVSGGKGATTAIETHGSKQSVHDNNVSDYYSGANITGVSATLSDQADVHNNIFTGVNNGIYIWSQNGGLNNVQIHDNNIEISHDHWIRASSDFPVGIGLYPTNNVNIVNLNIKNNSIVYLPVTVGAQSGELGAPGISLYNAAGTNGVVNLRIKDNYVKNSLSCGIRLAMPVTNGKISGNQFVDVATSVDAALPALYKCGILIVGSTYTDLKVEDNVSSDSRSTHILTSGIQLSGTTTATRISTKNNRVTASDGTSMVPVGPNSFITNVRIDEDMDVYATPPNAAIGSKIRDLATGSTWVQTTAPNGSTWANRAL